MDCTRAELAAAQILQNFGIVHPGTLDLKDLAMALGVLVTAGPLMGAEARLVRKGKRGIIRLNSSITNIPRQRFAVGHELGHWTQHNRNSQLKTCLEQDLSSYASSRLEIEANTFATHLLMPTPYVRAKYNDAPSFEMIKALSTDLQVSLTAAALRVVETTDDSCIVVIVDSATERVSWWRRSKSCSLWLEKQQRVSELSATYSLIRNSENMFIAEQCDPSAWFTTSPSKDLMVVEEGLLLANHSTAIVLLTICE